MTKPGRPGRDPREGGNAKLTRDDVLTLRQRYAEGATQRELCHIYGLSITSIGRIVRGETWRWAIEDAQRVGLDAMQTAPLVQVDPAATAASAERLRAILADGAEAPPAATAEPVAADAGNFPAPELPKE